MKNLVMIVCVVAFSSGRIYCQSTITEEEKMSAIETYQDSMEKLSLTEEQKPKVDEINMTYFEGLSKLRSSTGSRMGKYRTFKNLSSTRDRDMKAVLTQEQYVIYQENQREQRGKFKEHRKSR